MRSLSANGPDEQDGAAAEGRTDGADQKVVITATDPTLGVWSHLAIEDYPREWVALAPWMGLHVQPGATCRDPRTDLYWRPAFGVRIAAPAAGGSRGNRSN